MFNVKTLSVLRVNVGQVAAETDFIVQEPVWNVKVGGLAATGSPTHQKAALPLLLHWWGLLSLTSSSHFKKAAVS